MFANEETLVKEIAAELPTFTVRKKIEKRGSSCLVFMPKVNPLGLAAFLLIDKSLMETANAQEVAGYVIKGFLKAQRRYNKAR